MSNVGVHDFAIPHDFVQPTRDMVIIRMPLPPEKVGNLFIPDMLRDIAQHNVAAGRIVAMGPMAFHYKDGSDKLARHDVKVGDWVTIRPFAGTLVQGGKLVANSGWRYVSSFADVIGIIPADKMPDPSTLIWEEKNADAKHAANTAAASVPAAVPEEPARDRVECVGKGPCQTRGACIANGKCAAATPN